MLLYHQELAEFIVNGQTVWAISMVVVHSKRVMYVTGRGGSLQKGLADYLSSITDDFYGIAVDITFLRQEPLKQVAFIQAKIKEDPSRLVIANSYGAYLTLQALVEAKDIPNTVLLFSPVLGIAQAKDRMYLSRPPLTKRLATAFETSKVSNPSNMRVVIGSDDELYNEQQIKLINDYFGASTVVVLPNEGHMLSHAAVKDTIAELYEGVI